MYAIDYEKDDYFESTITIKFEPIFDYTSSTITLPDIEVNSETLIIEFENLPVCTFSLDITSLTKQRMRKLFLCKRTYRYFRYFIICNGIFNHLTYLYSKYSCFKDYQINNDHFPSLTELHLGVFRTNEINSLHTGLTKLCYFNAAGVITNEIIPAGVSLCLKNSTVGDLRSSGIRKIKTQYINGDNFKIDYDIFEEIPNIKLTLVEEINHIENNYMEIGDPSILDNEKIRKNIKKLIIEMDCNISVKSIKNIEIATNECTLTNTEDVEILRLRICDCGQHINNYPKLKILKIDSYWEEEDFRNFGIDNNQLFRDLSKYSDLRIKFII